jgi:2-isopropylmalate synthase
MTERIMIFDTTLRDGEQSPGAAMGVAEKLEVAKMLEQLGVDIIEAGFPISSPGDFQAVQTIAKEIKNCVICALTRARTEDIDVAAAALAKAQRPRIHTGLGVSDIHLKYKLHMSREEALEAGVRAVKYAKRFVEDVQYYVEDAGRADPEYLFQVLEAVIDAGATVVNIPDTTGYTTPEEWGGLIRAIRERVPNIHKATISVHCHNDLGMATANTLAGIRNGARQVEVTVNGIGERAGNASLEEVVMAIHTRRDLFDFTTGINTKLIYPISRLVSDLTGFVIPPNKAIVGSNAFAHSSGIHQDGMLKHRSTYEIINPEDIGVPVSEIVLSARSGRHALRHRLQELGYTLSEQEFERVYQRFLEVADKKPVVDDRDLEAIVSGETWPFMFETYELTRLQVVCGTNVMPTATVCLQSVDGKEICHTATGVGPIDATYKAIDAIVGEKVELVEFTVQAITEGIDAMGKVTTRIKAELPVNGGDEKVTRYFMGRGADLDIVTASAKAYLFALNRMLAAKQQTRNARKEAAEQIKQTLDQMQATHGSAHVNDYWGIGVMREEELK